jgi:hypothetical protein
MKTPIAITLIILGALLVMTPAVSDFLYQRNVVAMMSKPGVTSVTLVGQMSQWYRLGCWLTGSVMVACGILCSLSRRKHADEHEQFTSQPA